MSIIKAFLEFGRHISHRRASTLIAAACFAGGALFFLVATLAAEDEGALRHFEERIRPLLIDHCHKCHAGRKVEGDLRLDSPEGLARGSDNGPVVAKTPEDSRLIQAVRQQGDLKMPPNGRLSD